VVPTDDVRKGRRFAVTLLYYDDVFLSHDTGRHPECAERLRSIVDHLRQRGLWDQCPHPAVVPAELADVERVHDRAYIDMMRRVAEHGGGQIESDTVMSGGSYEAAIRAAGVATDAVRRVLAGEATTAVGLVRPPGHHALRGAPMGFCLFNNVAIAAEYALATGGLDRVLIVDWDVHHGNGTQDAFWTSQHVGFFSIHRSPFYPHTGAADEIGAGAGLGWTRNVPLAFGVSRADYVAAFQNALQDFAEQVRPQLVLMSAGFDAHRLDPIGSLGLEADDFRTLSQIVLAIAHAHCQGRVIGLLEGGYNTRVLPTCVEHMIAAMLPMEEKTEANTSPNQL
jgi:acetoin utilization deacetylase AcuC-like enzyme